MKNQRTGACRNKGQMDCLRPCADTDSFTSGKHQTLTTTATRDNTVQAGKWRMP